ncbi:MAG: glutamyl-tRNA reductase [Chthoniobacterales bacterium]|nr:glutamyl-tRNA reductase [Chthoniobacterales bacterium]
MHLFCVGISHHTANVQRRERYGLQHGVALPSRTEGCSESLLLTTCNRVELYAVAETAVSTSEIARSLLRDASSEETDGPEHFYRYDAEDCVQHLFRVAAGLDSMVIGETEILGQTKKAYEAARTSGSAGPCLHRLFQRAFRVAKQVRTRTDISRGTVSIGSVAVDLAVKIFGDLTERRVLLLGAGDAGERTARSLLSRGVADLRLANRSPERARALAELVGGNAVPFEQWQEQCREIDILISSTAAEEPLLTSELLAPILRERLDRPLFIIDIAVPRDVAPAVNEMEGVYLYDIDSLQSIAEQSRALRRQQIAAGETIIAGHVTEFSHTIGIATGRTSSGREIDAESLRPSEV